MSRVNEGELLVRVGDLAARTGVPMPAAKLCDGSCKTSRVTIKSRGREVPMMTVCRDVVVAVPEHILDFLIAQELMFSHLGYHRRVRVWNWSAWVVLMVATGVVDRVAQLNVIESGALPVIALFVAAYGGQLVIQRRCQFRSDRRIASIFGGEWVRDVLGFFIAGRTGAQGRRRLMARLMPSAEQRLARLA